MKRNFTGLKNDGWNLLQTLVTVFPGLIEPFHHEVNGADLVQWLAIELEKIDGPELREGLAGDMPKGAI